MRSFHAFLAMSVALSVPAAAQVAVATPEQLARRAQDRDHWVTNYEAMVRGETQQLRSAGLGFHWDAIRPLVARHLQPQEYLNASPAARDRLRAAHIDTTTNFIVRTGYRKRHLAHPAQARTVVRAANMSSWHDADALVLVSPRVFVADFVRIDRKPDNSADLVFRVREPIKGSPAVGSLHRVRLNGPHPTRLPEPPNMAIQELAQAKSVLFLETGPERIGNFLGSMPLSGNTVQPGYHSGTRPTTLPAIRAAARAQLCSPGYVPVVRGHDLPHRC